MSLRTDIEVLLGERVEVVDPVESGRQTRHRLRVLLADGRRVFVKADNRKQQVEALRRECLVNRALPEDMRPAVLAHGQGRSTGVTILAFEHLDRVRWLPPWEPGDIDAVLDLLARVAVTPAPSACRPLASHARLLAGWRLVALEEEAFAAVGLRSRAWLAREVPRLCRLEAEADLSGTTLVHFDVRSDNLYLDREGAGLVDWAWAVSGPPGFDTASWLPSLHLEGGPEPWALMPAADARTVALLAGYWASQALRPEPSGVRGLRALQRGQLDSCLQWLEHLGVVAA